MEKLLDCIIFGTMFIGVVISLIIDYKETIKTKEMIKVNKLDISLEFKVSYPEEYTETINCLFYHKTRVHKVKYKIVTITPILSIKVDNDTELDKELYEYWNHSFDGIFRRPSQNDRFTIRDADYTFFNCYVCNVMRIDNNNCKIYEIIPDYWNLDSLKFNNMQLIDYCGTYQIPIEVNTNYIKYIQDNKLRTIQ